MKKKENRDLTHVHATIIIILPITIVTMIIIGILVEQIALITKAIIGIVIAILIAKICITIRKVCKSYLNKKDK